MSASRQLAAIMFTDIVGYTALMQQNEQRAVTVVKRRNACLEKLIVDYRGKILDYIGDGSLSIFPSATDAVKCSIELQKALRTEPVVLLRIGLHIGEVFFEDEKVFGDGVNVASRIQSLGKENTVLISGEIHDKIKNNASITTVLLGRFDFKNVDKPMEVFALTNDGLSLPQRNTMEGNLTRKDIKKRNGLIAFSLILFMAAAFIVYKNTFASNATLVIDKSIAVLPFTDMSQNKDQEFFSDGLTEDIITQLAKINSFKVISRTSVMQYKKSSKSLKEIGKELGAAIILEGSLQHSGDKVRINAQLINAATDEHLWAETYDRSIKDIFSIQTEIATQISAALKAELSPEEQQLIEKKDTENSEAYQLYLKGRYYWNKRLEEPVKKSIEYFKQAIEKDSTYAMAYAGLGDAYLMLGVYSVVRPDESFPLSKMYSEKALKLDNTLAEAYSTLIDYNIHYTWDADEADRYFHKAIESNSGYATAYHWHSEVYVMRKQFNKAIYESEAALQIEPYSLIINTQLGTNYIFAGEFAKAVDQLKKTVEFDSTFAVPHYNLGIAYAGLKQYDMAFIHLHKANTLAPGNTRIMSTLGYVAGMTGKMEETKHIKKELFNIAGNKFVSAFDLAVITLGSGDKKLALQFLQQAFEERGPLMPFIGMNPLFRSLHDEQEFQTLVRKIEK